MVPVGGATDEPLVAALVELVNAAYDEVERGLWTKPLPRTSVDETAAAIGRGEQLVARWHGDLVGAVQHRRGDDGAGWFGALATRPGHGGRGVGRALVDQVERAAAAAGAPAMELELLAPDAPHPHAARLAAWYRSLGYREIDRYDIGVLDPGCVPFLVGPIAVSVMRKPLS